MALTGMDEDGHERAPMGTDAADRPTARHAVAPLFPGP